MQAFHHSRQPKDVSLGGMRVYSDERLDVGRSLDVDVMLPHGDPVRLWATVVWVVELGQDGPARYDVGLKFSDMAEGDFQRLAGVLVRSG